MADEDIAIVIAIDYSDKIISVRLPNADVQHWSFDKVQAQCIDRIR